MEMLICPKYAILATFKTRACLKVQSGTFSHFHFLKVRNLAIAWIKHRGKDYVGYLWSLEENAKDAPNKFAQKLRWSGSIFWNVWSDHFVTCFKGNMFFCTWPQVFSGILSVKENCNTLSGAFRICKRQVVPSKVSEQKLTDIDEYEEEEDFCKISLEKFAWNPEEDEEFSKISILEKCAWKLERGANYGGGPAA